MANEIEAKSAIDAMNGHEINGVLMKVEVCI